MINQSTQKWAKFGPEEMAYSQIKVVEGNGKLLPDHCISNKQSSDLRAWILSINSNGLGLRRIGVRYPAGEAVSPSC